MEQIAADRILTMTLFTPILLSLLFATMLLDSKPCWSFPTSCRYHQQWPVEEFWKWSNGDKDNREQWVLLFFQSMACILWLDCVFEMMFLKLLGIHTILSLLGLLVWKTLHEKEGYGKWRWDSKDTDLGRPSIRWHKNGWEPSGTKTTFIQRLLMKQTQ